MIGLVLLLGCSLQFQRSLPTCFGGVGSEPHGEDPLWLAETRVVSPLSPAVECAKSLLVNFFLVVLVNARERERERKTVDLLQT